MDWFRFQYKTNLQTNRKRGSFSTNGELHGARAIKCDNNKSNNRSRKHSSNAVNLSKIALLILLSPAPVLANAVSQSNTGSVTNQNYNVNNGNFHTNQYGGNIVCQGPMMNITPFSTFNTNFQKPFDHRYHTPVYDPTDLIGDFDDEGNETSIDYKRMMEIVKRSGYQGYVGIEYEGNRLGEDDGIIATKKLLEKFI